MADEFPSLVTKKELIQVCAETQDMINGLRIAVNIHAEIAGLHRYLLEQFIPAKILTEAVNEYSKLRSEAIEQERLKDLGLSAAVSGN